MGRFAISTFWTWLLVLAAAPLAHAQTQSPTPTLPVLRLRVDPTLFAGRWIWSEQTVEVPPITPSSPARTQTIESSSSALDVGLFSGDVALGIGASVEDLLNIGVATYLAMQSGETETKVRGALSDGTDSVRTKNTRVWFVPYLEFVARGEERVRPFVGFHAGIGYSFTKVEMGKDLSATEGVFGLSGGVHYFVNDHVSLDPHVRVFGHVGSAGDASQYGVSAAAVFGVSAWVDVEPRTREGGADMQASPGRNAPMQPVDTRAAVAIAPAPRPDPSSVPSTPATNPTRQRLVLGDVTLHMTVTRARRDVVELHVSRPRQPTQADRLACGNVVIVSGGSRTTVATHGYRVLTQEGRAVEQVQADAPLPVLRSLVDEGQRLTAMELCGQREYITLAHRNQVRALVDAHDAMFPPTPAAAPNEAAAPTPEASATPVDAAATTADVPSDTPPVAE